MKIASYNVDNLFDLKKSGHEYKEYIPNTRSEWNSKNYKIKLKHIARVIKDVNADIIALQEIESLKALKDLQLTLKKDGLYYQYFKIANAKNTTVKVALLSKIPFIYTHEVMVTSSYKYRNILEVKFKINSQELYLFINHWKAKSGPESRRIISAKKLLHRIHEIGSDKNIILLGDFNSDYEENVRFKRERRLNDTGGKTGINDVLHTSYQKQRASQTKFKENSFYNLWYDTDTKNRFSYIFKGKKEAIDNIIISQAMLKHYKSNTIHSLQERYLFHKRHISRWQTAKRPPYKHKGKGYSDHLPVMAQFSF